MRLIYIAGKYRSLDGVNGIYKNIQAARAEALKWWRKGWAVICPHTNTAFMDGACHDDVWLNGDLEILARCDAVAMLPGWDESVGARAEHDAAIELDLEVYYV